MEITFLGTGSGMPSKNRNVSSLALKMLQERDEIWLFDCGEATQHQILKTTIKPRKITKIFITHMHGDHVLGLPGLLSSRSFQDGTTPIEIYGPPELKEFVNTSLRTTGTHLNYPIVFIPISETTVFEDEHISVSVKKLNHGMPSYAYKIEEKDQIGPLLPEKLKQLGVAPGPLYETIKNQSTTTLPNGQIIHRKDVTGPDIQGRKIAIFGDTRPVIEQADWIHGIDLLIHEATFLESDQALAHDYFHSTATHAATLAQKAQVKHLIMNHISSRYHSDELVKEIQHLKAIFPSLTYAEDFMTYEIKR